MFTFVKLKKKMDNYLLLPSLLLEDLGIENKDS